MRNCFLLLVFVLAAPMDGESHEWMQTDWSGGGGQLILTDSTMYYESTSTTEQGGDVSLSVSVVFCEIARLEDTKRIYCLMQDSAGAIYASSGDTRARIFKSVDYGANWDTLFYHSTWRVAHSVLKLAGDIYFPIDHSSNTVYVVKFDGDGPSRTFQHFPSATAGYCIVSAFGHLFLGTGDNSAAVHKGIFGGTFQTTTFPDKQVLSMLSASDGILYAGTGYDYGNVVKSIDQGTSWDTTLGDLSGATSVYCLAEGADSTVYAGTGPDGKVFRTTDKGITWDSCAELSGAIEVYSLLVDNDGNLYAGTRCVGDTARIFKSVTGGNIWFDCGVLEGASSVRSLLQCDNGSIFVGTGDEGRTYTLTSPYDSIGWLVSSVYNVGTDNGSVKYDTIYWDVDYNDQDVIVKARSFNDTVTWSDTIPWSDCSPCSSGQYLPLLSSVRDSVQFVQYRLEFSTQNPFITPVFREISVSYSLDTIAPRIDRAEAYGDEEFIPPDSAILKDRVVIWFDQRVDTFMIDSLNIDSLLKVSGEHTWVDSLGSVAASWDTTCRVLIISLGDSVWSKWVNVGDTIYPAAYQNDSIADIWGNKCTSPCVIGGSFGPAFDSVVAHEGLDSLEYVDNDDYVTFYFSKRTNKPRIDASNIDSILRIPGRTWLDGFGELRGDSCVWDSLGFALTCSLKIDSLRPTIRVGDTVWSDSVTIWDKFERGVVVSPCVIQGTFGEYGPIMEQATAYEGWPSDAGVGDGDYVWISFNKLIDTLDWSSLDVDTVLIAQNSGIIHTWHPESLDCHVQQMEQQDAQGFPYTLLLVSFEKWDTSSVEESSEFVVRSSGLRCYPSPSLGGTMIEFYVPSSEFVVRSSESQDTRDEHNSQLSMSNEQLAMTRRMSTGKDACGTGRVGDANQGASFTAHNVRSLASHGTSLGSRLSLLDSLSLAIGDTIYPNPNVITDFQGRGGRRFVILEGELKDNESNDQLSISNGQLATKSKYRIHDPSPVTSDLSLRTTNSELRTTVKIYSLAGRLVRTLVDKEVAPGAHKVLWDGKDGQGRNVRSGVYFCKLRVGEKTSIRKLTVLSSF